MAGQGFPAPRQVIRAVSLSSHHYMRHIQDKLHKELNVEQGALSREDNIDVRHGGDCTECSGQRGNATGTPHITGDSRYSYICGQCYCSIDIAQPAEESTCSYCR